MSNATFFNFTSEPFTAYWDGKAKTVKAGEKVLMPEFLAEHFAKHLTNQELIKAGKEVYTSPKNPGQVHQFMDIFKKAFIPEAPLAKGSNEIDELIASAQSEPSMDIEVKKPEPTDDGPAAAMKKKRGRKTKDEESEIINPPDGDDEDFDFKE